MEEICGDKIYNLIYQHKYQLVCKSKIKKMA